MSDLSFFDATLAQLSQLSALRSCSADTKVPDGLRYPPGHFDFKMPSVQTSKVPPEEREDYFSLTFRTLKTPVRKFTLHTSSVRTVAQVKKHLSRISNIPVNSMRLVLNGKGLVDSKLIGDYNIQDKSVIQIISKPATGATADDSPTTEEQSDKAALVDDAAAESNPLSSALKQQDTGISATAVPQKKVPDGGRSISAKDRVLAENSEYNTDMSSDGESETKISQATKDQLKQSNSSFRNALREFVHTKFSNSQATAVDRALGEYFSTL
ncbi:hypothetical protein H4R99_000157 [Coemansia sp. RSA 1722]|nr:hypothetical protein H4R99_000157 [Coemansia sp. RSA 1722]KAJ2639855.1 hypothetical protein GGF40_000537 [Coemansia sp. RSA 1286]